MEAKPFQLVASEATLALFRLTIASSGHHPYGVRQPCCRFSLPRVTKSLFLAVRTPLQLSGTIVSLYSCPSLPFRFHIVRNVPRSSVVALLYFQRSIQSRIQTQHPTFR